jgi:hypothetical protein
MPFGSCVPLYPTPSPCSKIEPLRNGHAPKSKQKTADTVRHKRGTGQAAVTGAAMGQAGVERRLERGRNVQNEFLYTVIA